MRHRSVFFLCRTGLYLFLFSIAAPADGLAQGFPMMGSGIPGMGSGIPGMGSGIPGMSPFSGLNQGFPNSGMNMPGFGRGFPNTNMNLPDFGQNFPNMNMKIPNMNGPGNFPGFSQNRNFPNPFSGFPNGRLNTGTALYDIGFYRRSTGQYARIIMQAYMAGQNLTVRQCTQPMQQSAMECRTFVNGRIIRVNYVRAPDRRASFSAPQQGEGFQMQGSGVWRDMEVIGTFQYRYNRPRYN